MNCSAGCSCNFVLVIDRSNTSRIREGWVTERSIVHAWKACVPQGTRGSNPLPSVFPVPSSIIGVCITLPHNNKRICSPGVQGCVDKGRACGPGPGLLYSSLL